MDAFLSVAKYFAYLLSFLLAEFLIQTRASAPSAI